MVIDKLNKTAGWPLLFKKNDTDVTKEDLGTRGGGLDDATFHFHSSHGGRLLPGQNTLLELSNGVYLDPLELQKMWGKNNKWVMIDACQVLDDLTWGGALNTSHGIFGYKTDVGASSGTYMTQDFFDNAFQGETLFDSYRNATKYGAQYSNVTNVRGAVIFHNIQQAQGDHLPGYGTIEPDANPDDAPWETNWSCQGE